MRDSVIRISIDKLKSGGCEIRITQSLRTRLGPG